MGGGPSALILRTIQEKDTDNLPKLLSTLKPTKVNGRDPKDGKTPLMWACIACEGDVVKVLLDHGADIHATDAHGWTALRWAVRRGRVEVIKTLLCYGADTDSLICTRAHTHTRTHTAHTHTNEAGGVSAASNSNAGGSSSSCKNGCSGGGGGGSSGGSSDPSNNGQSSTSRKNKASHEIMDTDGETVLMLACGRGGNVEVVRALLAGGADPDVRDTCGRTALMHAAYAGNLEAIWALRAHNAHVCVTDSKGRCVLDHADKTDARVVEELKQPAPPLMLLDAAREGNVEHISQLVEAISAADINARDSFGKTPLMWASMRGHTDVVQALLEHGADPSAKDCHGWTALRWAARFRRAHTLRVLIAHTHTRVCGSGRVEEGRREADKGDGKVHDDGLEPLMLLLARHADSIESMNILVEGGCVCVGDINHISVSALMMACAHAHTHLAHALIHTLHTRVSHTDVNGKTAVEYTRRCYGDIRKMLKEAVKSSPPAAH